MFRYEIRGESNRWRGSRVIALTSFVDLAEYIVKNAPNALDKDGDAELKIFVREHTDEERLIHETKPVEENKPAEGSEAVAEINPL